MSGTAGGAVGSWCLPETAARSEADGCAIGRADENAEKAGILENAGCCHYTLFT